MVNIDTISRRWRKCSSVTEKEQDVAEFIRTHCVINIRPCASNIN